MLRTFFQNAGNPGVNRGGELMLWMMNYTHQKILRWSRKFYGIPEGASVLDIGCGNGRNIDNMRRIAPSAKFYGVDRSPLCVRKSQELNRTAIREGRVLILNGSVEKLPFSPHSFDLATASNTIYFWPNLPDNFREVYRVLKPSGVFLICNGTSEPEQAEKWLRLVDGMRAYSRDQLSEYLSTAGFSGLEFHLHENRQWLCVTGIKK
ncbi:MAG: Erythromycin 3''-O-methyltransferase [Lentisphaerae bacterium ADurb.Bin242]|nr:MAG: Erythromycin 3''-O-methyltransferase [Lentisphaerae bacterium ADurb.Bin242]